MAANVAAILKRRSELRAERDQYASLWQEIAEHVIPHKSNIIRLLSPGEKQTRELFDSTAIHGSETLAASIHGTLTPGTQPWLSLKVRQEELNDNGEVKDWLEDCARRIHAALRQSNWTTSVHEMYLDLVGPAGMGCLFVEEKAPPAAGTFGGFRFSTHGPGEYTVSEDAEGRIDTVFREMRLTARAIAMKWPGKGGDKVQEAARNKPEERYTVLHAVYPREDYSASEKKRGSLNMAWASCYLVVETRAKLDEGGFPEHPFMTPRWAKTSGEVYGRGPSHTALPDVKTLNKVKEFLLQAAPLAMFPPTLEADDAVIGEPDLTPAGRNVVNTMGGRSIDELFRFMQTGVKIDVSQIIIGDLRQSIRDMYFSHQLELQDKPAMTATEVQVRYELMQRILGPTLGRLETEFLNPLVERCFALMARAGALLPAPDVLMQQGGEQADLDIQYEGPLARAQRTVELTAQDRVLSFVAALTQAMVAAGVPPTQAAAVWDVLKVDKWLRDRSEITGIRADSLNSVEETTQIRSDRAQAEQQAAQMQQAQQMAEIAQKGAPMLKALHEASTNGGQQPEAA